MGDAPKAALGLQAPQRDAQTFGSFAFGEEFRNG
jgi:hypothetical protein